MTKEKTELIQKMEEHRFLPITQETLSLYRVYDSLIDHHDPDELSYLHFYEGEYFFRIGDFRHALNFLTRCIHAPKSTDLKYLDASSYNLIGLIYNYLGQENIAITYLLLAKSISNELQSAWGAAVACTNLGQIYAQLEIYDTALSYYNQAFEYAERSDHDLYNLKVSCYACCAILYCRLHEYDKAIHLSKAIEQLIQKNDTIFYDIAIIDLNIRLADYFKDEVMLQQNFHKLLTFNSSGIDFLEFSEFYFDLCNYFLTTKRQAECDAIFSHISRCLAHSTLTFLRYRYLEHQVSYAKLFFDETAYLKACSQLISLRPDYLDEQRAAKLYSLEYVERLRQTKHDSEILREKSRIDPMTGLLNKYTIQFLIEEDLSKSSPAKQSAMLLIDLDHFKQINDTLGHLMGDTFICQTGSIIHNYFKDTALCGRIGGDEFLVYISNVTDTTFLMLQAEVLRQEIYRQTSRHNITITTQASIGIALSSEYRCDYESLFSAADDALYRAKLAGRNKVIAAE